MSTYVNQIIKNWLIPNGYFKLYNNIKKILKKDRFNKKLFQSNLKYKDLHKGERCFILASGPSIKNQNLTSIYGETCIAVSHFHLHKDILKINPKYHILAPSHHPFTFEDIKKFFEDFKTSYPKREVEIFLSLIPYDYNYISFLEQNPCFNDFNYNYINYSDSQPITQENHLEKRIWDISLSPFSIRTVLYSAIQLAVFMGFKDIYIVGADHDYLNDTKRLTNHHFYAENKGLDDSKHLSSFNTERWFEEYYFRWKEYRFMNLFCKSNNINIYNATEGGLLDIFERKKISTIDNEN